MRKYYSDFVAHCTRYYFSTEVTPTPQMRVEYNNYIAVANVLNGYDLPTQQTIRQLYTADCMSDEANKIAVKLSLKPQNIWYIVSQFERSVAKERGLI